MFPVFDEGVSEFGRETVLVVLFTATRFRADERTDPLKRPDGKRKAKTETI
jgi:hypothetical protein